MWVAYLPRALIWNPKPWRTVGKGTSSNDDLSKDPGEDSNEYLSETQSEDPSEGPSEVQNEPLHETYGTEWQSQNQIPSWSWMSQYDKDDNSCLVSYEMVFWEGFRIDERFKMHRHYHSQNPTNTFVGDAEFKQIEVSGVLRHGTLKFKGSSGDRQYFDVQVKNHWSGNHISWN